MKRVHARVRHGEQTVSGEVTGDSLVIEAVEGAGPLAPGARVALGSVKVLPPVTPSKVVAVALNYRAHANEMSKPVPEEPMFFLKPPTAIIGDGDAIVLPPASAEVHHEGELGVVIGKRLSRVSPGQAMEGVLGVTCVNDVTARDIQRRQNHYTRSKGYDTFCPIGPWLVTGIDFTDLRLRVRVNGQVRQDGRTSEMIFNPARLLSFISQVMTLLPGDVVSTGTPLGVGPLRAGDTVEVDIDGVGVLRNHVVVSP